MHCGHAFQELCLWMQRLNPALVEGSQPHLAEAAGTSPSETERL